MGWFWQCGNKKFDNKISAIKENVATGNSIKFISPYEYDNIDFSIEPADSWHQLLKSRAQELRQKHKKIRLWFSGGCDSVTMLRSFVNNNIFIDEIIVQKCGIPAADWEINEVAIPFLLSIKNLIPFTKITITEPEFGYYEKIYKNSKWLDQIDTTGCYHFRANLHEEYAIVKNTSENVINLLGREKPSIVFRNNQWYFYFLDSEIEPVATSNENTVFFFSDDPLVHSKQCHMLKNYIESTMSLEQYNSPQKINLIPQDTKNYGAGRIASQNHYFIPKNVQGQIVQTDDGFFYGKNLKEHLALQYVANNNPYILLQWKSHLSNFAENTGKDWFNEGRPEFGTVGCFSNFYSLSTNEIKTVDDLFPNTFYG